MLQRIIAFSFLLFLVSKSQAQDWFPVGASWYYNQVIFFTGNSYQQFEVIDEVIINGKVCRVVVGSCHCSEYGTINYLHQDGDLIYSYDYDTDQFTLLYNFSLLPGDTMRYHTPATGDTYYLLDSITYWTVNTQTLRVQHFTLLDGWAALGLTVYENIGSDYCLYPQIGFCDPNTGPLRCYEDSLTGLIKFIEPELPCDYTTAVSDQKEVSVNVYPNPAESFIMVESPDLIGKLDLIELQSGIVMIHAVSKVFRYEMEISALHAGSYVLRVIMADGKVVMKKVIIVE